MSDIMGRTAVAMLGEALDDAQADGRAYVLEQGNEIIQPSDEAKAKFDSLLKPIQDEWVAEIPEARFPEVLPLLRRAFAGFTGPEREKMFALARSGVAAGETATPDVASAFGQKRAKTVLPTLRMLLGLEED